MWTGKIVSISEGKKSNQESLVKLKKNILIGGEMHLGSSNSQCPISVRNMQVTYELGKKYTEES